MKPPMQAVKDPSGRVDVLLYRLTERIVREHCPAAWPVLDQAVARWCKKNFGLKRRRRRTTL